MKQRDNKSLKKHTIKVAQLMIKNIKRINNLTKFDAIMYKLIEFPNESSNYVEFWYVDKSYILRNSGIMFSDKRHVRKTKSLFKRNLIITTQIPEIAKGERIDVGNYEYNCVLALANGTFDYSEVAA